MKKIYVFFILSFLFCQMIIISSIKGDVNSPVAITNDPIAVESYRCNVSGGILNDGGENCTAYFEYGTTEAYGNTINPFIVTWFNQTVGGEYNSLYSSGVKKIGIVFRDFKGIPLNTQMKLTKVNTPTGNYYIKILNFDSKTVIGTYQYSANINTLPNWVSSTITKIYWHDYDITYINGEDILIDIEYQNTDNPNVVYVEGSNSDEGFETFRYLSSWGAYTKDIWMKLKFLNDVGNFPFNNSTGISLTGYLTDLIPGKLYHYRFVTNNTVDISYGTDKYFLTKPTDPTGISIIGIENGHNISWTHGIGYNKSVLVYKEGSYPNNPQDGTVIYNGSLNYYEHLNGVYGSFYYSVWEYSEWNDPNTYAFSENSDFDYIENYMPPVVLTNESTGIEENNATMNGFLIEDGGDISGALIKFFYDEHSIYSYGVNYTLLSNVTIGYRNSSEEFSYNLSGLNEGQIYSYIAFANNTNGTDLGEEKYFLTKPTDPGNLTIVQIDNGLNISWDHGTGYNKSVLVFKKGSYPNNPQDGTVIYNGSLDYYIHSGLSGEINYFYKVWEYSQWIENTTLFQFSNGNSSGNETFYVAPSVYDPIPRDNKLSISIYLENVSIIIEEINSTVYFNYTIETSPDIGSITENNVLSGVKTLTVSGLEYNTEYTWFVNATYEGLWTNKTYSFTTKKSNYYDFQDFNNGMIDWSLGPYEVYLDDIIWPFIFLGAIGLTWGSTQHVSSTLAVILLTFGAFGFKKGFINNPEISLFFSIIAVLCVTGLIIALFLKKRNDYG